MPVMEAGDLYKDRGAKFIATYSGTHFSLEDPQFETQDIAHSLSMLCRYNGHCDEFYSVAEHSVLVSRLVAHMGGSPTEQLEGLLHDATEAYLSDVPAPFKQHLADWKKVDDDLDHKLRLWAGLPLKKSHIVKEADWLALYIEAYQLFPDRGECFTGPDGMRKRALNIYWDCPTLAYVQCYWPQEIKEIFLRRWYELSDIVAGS
jgi:uncharacterized protein